MIEAKATKNQIRLDLKEMLPTIIKGVQEKTLQCYKENDSIKCFYAGPCVIGICLPEDIRSVLDNSVISEVCDKFGITPTEDNEEELVEYAKFNSSFFEYHILGVFIVDNDNQVHELDHLQTLHDDVVRAGSDPNSKYKILQFEHYVKELAKKYNVPWGKSEIANESNLG